jgi:hypothetical protein
MPAIFPTNIEAQQSNEYYPTEEAYLYAIADPMREEYNRIIGAGFLPHPAFQNYPSRGLCSENL